MNLRRSALAAAIFAAAAFTSAQAADVTVYGRVDLGLAYAHTDTDTAAGSSSTFSMDASNGTSSRFGIKGSEKINDDLTVRFVLENGFDPDTGALHTEGSIFDREATLQLVTSYGTVAFGRSSILGTDGGTFNLLGNINPMGTGVGNVGNQNTVFAKFSDSRFDNAVIYRTPEFAGAQITAEYSMGAQDEENTSASDRYFGLGATWKGGNIETVALFESVNEDSADADAAGNVTVTDKKDVWRMTVGGNVKFEPATVYAGVQYFRNADKLGAMGWTDGIKAIGKSTFDEIKGTGVVLGLSSDIAGGTLMISAGAMSAKTTENNETVKFKNVNAGAAYFYPLSKRTKLYGAAGWSKSSYKSETETVKPEAIYALAGMAHYF